MPEDTKLTELRAAVQDASRRFDAAKRALEAHQIATCPWKVGDVVHLPEMTLRRRQDVARIAKIGPPEYDHRGCVLYVNYKLKGGEWSDHIRKLWDHEQQGMVLMERPDQ